LLLLTNIANGSFSIVDGDGKCDFLIVDKTTGAVRLDVSFLATNRLNINRFICYGTIIPQPPTRSHLRTWALILMEEAAQIHTVLVFLTLE
jgi:hypothetical protein